VAFIWEDQLMDKAFDLPSGHDADARPGPSTCSSTQAEEIHSSLLTKVEEVPRHLVHRAVGKVKDTYGVLAQRYGPGYARAIIGAGLVGLPMPIPFSTALTAAPVLAAAEVHRALADKHVLQQSAAAVTLTAEHIQTLGKHWIEELLHVFASTTDQPSDFEHLLQKKERDLRRPLTDAEQRELLARFLLDVESPA
jgi:hypothetical protein